MKNHEEIIEHIASLYEDIFYSGLAHFEANYKITSPIERIFIAWWVFWCDLCGKQVQIIPQYQVEQYKADFFIPSTNKIIELDGHIWHEKTPDQCEKDRVRERFLIGKGYVVIRFTGREILRDGEQHVEALYHEAAKCQP